jgi:hypothetical protein
MAKPSSHLQQQAAPLRSADQPEITQFGGAILKPLLTAVAKAFDPRSSRRS